jgi:molybdopterin synthase sulfur carrier subunit
MATISLYYWAGAKAAAGLEMERFEATSIGVALTMARERHRDASFDRVLSVSSLLVDGSVIRKEDLDRPLAEPVRVEILPPFAGGAA